jgi:hypothetical protein
MIGLLGDERRMAASPDNGEKEVMFRELMRKREKILNRGDKAARPRRYFATAVRYFVDVS